MPRQDFREVLLEAVDEGLASLGESSKKAIYFHLEKSFNIEKREIPYKIEPFTEAIETIFGLGAKNLEILIMRQLHQKIGRTVQLNQSGDFTFLEYVTAAKRSLLEKGEARKKRRS